MPLRTGPESSVSRTDLYCCDMDLSDIGNLFVVGIQGTEFSSEIGEFLDDFRPAGVVLFARNIEHPVQVARLNGQLQRRALSCSSGLLLAVDQEGGRVRRLRQPFAEFPPALTMAASRDPEEAVRHFAALTARELRLVGFTVDFAPVMDVLSVTRDLQSSVIGDRSFGTDPLEVARLGRVVIQTLRSFGIVPCAKHFPGHGGTMVDSHLDLPVDSRPRDLLEQCDLIPFSAAVNCSVEMIMTAHVLFPELDPDWPATLSPAILDELLRHRMGYRGVAITDDLDMGAVTRNYSSEECALRAFMAGADLLLICHSLEKAYSARSAIHRAVLEGVIPVGRIEESLKRIHGLKSQYAASAVPCDERVAARYFEAKEDRRTV